mgnify:CR=1 FL=1|tara:strand:+ start:214 stop:780 length:567 start_codon:yes stop_codon:yes gene_type:complete
MARKKINTTLKTKRMFVTGSSRTKGTDTFLTSSYNHMSASFASNEYLDDSGIWESQGAIIYQLQNIKDDIDDLHSEISSSIYVSQVNSGSSISQINTFTARDTTPSVLNGTLFKTANDRPTAITTFDDGIEGQRITILINDTRTNFTHDSRTLTLNGAASWTASSTGDSIEFVYNGSAWIETNRSDNT